MFENLTDKLSTVFKQLKGHGKLDEKNVQEGLKAVRVALLEADVHYKVVKKLIEDIRVRSLGQEVMESLTPGQQVVKIVNDELTKLMGLRHEDINLSGAKPAAVMLVGLQGSGKTTTAGKLAVYLRKKGHKPYLVPLDIYRPAAIEQLTKLGEQIGVPTYPTTTDMDPVFIAEDAKRIAATQGADVILLDTAGRLHIDDALMQELSRIRDAVHPSDILLVADAMTGQDAVNMATSFHQAVGIGGVVLTKMDGDARGGAALSIKAMIERPVKYVGIGEKLGDIEPFHPERMASRILGMGDLLTMIEKAQAVVDQKKAIELEKKLRKNQFTLEDFRDQMIQIRKMGSIGDLIRMIPGLGQNKAFKDIDVDEKELAHIIAIINSMTPQERKKHDIINANRKRRIATGSGTSVQDVNNLLKNYEHVLRMMKQFTKGGMKRMGRGMLKF
ncbi:signal recognition particle protein [Desulfatirhabdium butyrativorans]|uniref:signal recognition particle protein n=1 Tax=Desulfatirhabdium butyrativorans TaxID=340467 RepID=UPI000410ED2D|nr:signal recognition particle protein [Desulfatirhabdium butyrativorans]